ncbi:MAG: cytidylate kinase family protein [Candidatus Diapherotrites archaeon]
MTVIIVSGFSGSGKSELVEAIAKKFNLKCVHSSGLLRKLKEDHKLDLSEEPSEKNIGWWESREGKEYFKQRLKNSKFDKILDGQLLKIISRGKVAMDSWTMGYLSRKGFKIWLKVDDKERAKRIAVRDNLPFKEVLKRIKHKEFATKKIYKKIYGFTAGEDLKPFNLVIDTTHLAQEETHEIILGYLEKIIGKI